MKRQGKSDRKAGKATGTNGSKNSPTRKKTATRQGGANGPNANGPNQAFSRAAANANPSANAQLGPDSHQTEEEFGVPIPGQILPPEQWAKTALKKVPDGHISWSQLFEREAPVVIDIGCGNGRSTLTSAVDRPEINHLGADILAVVIRYATRRGNQRGLSNTRWAVIGGRELLLNHVAPGSVSEIHCFHPQPYYRQDQVGLRLITPEFLLLVHRSLVSGGRLVLQTDHPGYWKYMMNVVPVFFEFHERRMPWPNAMNGMTRREIIARSRGLSIFRGEGTARTDLDPDEALRLAESLPLPTFNADRRLQSLDSLEREGSDGRSQSRSQSRSSRRPQRRSRRR